MIFIGKLKKPLVLIVEDDPWIRRISGELLEDEGVLIASADDGETGLALAQRLQPTVILLDLGLPRMSGSEFLTRLRGNPGLRETPVLVVSAQAVSEGVAALADGILRKPFDLIELMERIDQAATVGQQR